MTKPNAHPWLLPMMTLAMMAGILIGRSVGSCFPALAALLLCSTGAILARDRLRCLCICLAVLCVGCCVSWRAYHPTLPPEGAYALTGVVTEIPEVRENGQVQTVLSNIEANGQPLRTKAYWTFYLDEGEALPGFLSAGASVTFQGRIYHPSGASIPGGFDFREYLLQRGMTIGVYGADELAQGGNRFSFAGLPAMLQQKLSQRLMAVMGPEAGGYAAAMLLGQRDFIPLEDREAFRQLGISHILAVSGYHVGVLVMLIGALAQRCGLSRRWRLALYVPLLGGYCLLTGAAAPVIRASLLLALRESGKLRHRQNLPLHLLCASACLQLLFSPASLTSVSFQLSYGAMLGLVLIAPTLEHALRIRKPFLRKIWQLTSASLGVQLGILPVQLWWFAETPLLSVVINVFVLSLAGYLLALYWAVLILLPIPLISQAIGTLAAWVTKPVLYAIRTIGHLPGMTLWTGRPDPVSLAGMALITIACLWLLPHGRPRLRRFLLLTGSALTAFMLIPFPHTETTYLQFSVGDADAAVLHDRDQVIVIDAGTQGSGLADWLYTRRMSVDALILTHLHEDHAGGAIDLLDRGIPIRTVYLPGDAEQAEIDPGMPELLERLRSSGVEIRYLFRGDTVGIPSGQLTTLWPVPGRPAGQDANHGSLTLLAEVRGVTLLLTGDLTGRYEHYTAVPADLLKAAHHGSAESTLPGYLEAVDPQAILLSTGSAERVEDFSARVGDYPIHNTNNAGTLILRFDEGSIRMYQTNRSE